MITVSKYNLKAKNLMKIWKIIMNSKKIKKNNYSI